MSENYMSELKVQLEGMNMYHSYQNKINSLQKEIKCLQLETDELLAACNKENKDVADLEKGGLHAFYLKVRGKYEESMDKEVLEAAEAKVKLQNKQFELEDANKKLRGLEEAQSEYVDCEDKYKALYQLRLEELLSEENEVQLALLNYQNAITESEHSIKEIREAVFAGNKVYDELKRVEKSLDSASSWGTFDIIGGGTLTDLAKHSDLDDAKKRLNTVQRLMREFNTELADVKLTLDIQIDTDGFAKFADFFFDGLFADIGMQHRIENSLESVKASKRKVDDVLEHLRILGDQEERAILQYKEKIQEIVNQSED